MDVEIFSISFQKSRVLGVVGDDPEFDLTVIGRKEDPLRRRGYKSGPDSSPLGSPDRDVLQIRMFRGQPTGCSAGLLKTGMDMS